MRVDCALLCDAATVREGLLHILGGGVTRIGRPEFPAPVGLTLALRVAVHPTETEAEHRLEAQLVDFDGGHVIDIEVSFTTGSNAETPGVGDEIGVNIPLVFPAQAVLEKPGRYSVELLIDGIHQLSIPFRADLVPNEPEPDPDAG
ncbi:MAG: hypothetical protein M9938_11490 [Solirubrobacterales bacterium]|nr:hypothetical protein [Solirubrobacterales bacterium]